MKTLHYFTDVYGPRSDRFAEVKNGWRIRNETDEGVEFR